MRVTLGIAAMLLVTTSGAVALADATLTGRLISPDGTTPIREFPVIIEGAENTFVTTTDRDGNFELLGLPPGEYEVTPANEPGLARSVTIERAPWWRLGQATSGGPVEIGDIYLETNKSYIQR